MRALFLTLVATIAPVIALPQEALTPSVPLEATPQAVDVVVAPAGATQELRLHDGSRLLGRVEYLEDERVWFRTITGHRLEISQGEIVGLRLVRGQTRKGEFFVEDPNGTRLFFGPTARALRRGRGYLGVFEVFAPFVEVGVTDRITFGGGTPLFFGEDIEHPLWVTPKIQLLNASHTKVAVGLLHVFNFEHDNAGIAYGVLTQGTEDHAVTVGAGYGYRRSDWDNDSTGILMIGGETRVSPHLKLITENYVWRNGDGFLSGGVRFFGERVSADLGLATPIGPGVDFLVFPVVSFVWMF